MNYHLLRHRADEVIVFHRDMSSYCCSVGKQLIYHQARTAFA